MSKSRVCVLYLMVEKSNKTNYRCKHFLLKVPETVHEVLSDPNHRLVTVYQSPYLFIFKIFCLINFGVLLMSEQFEQVGSIGYNDFLTKEFLWAKFLIVDNLEGKVTR